MPPQLLVGGLIDHTHAALTQPADDLIVPKDSTGSQFVHSNILRPEGERGKKFFFCAAWGVFLMLIFTSTK